MRVLALALMVLLLLPVAGAEHALPDRAIRGVALPDLAGPLDGTMVRHMPDVEALFAQWEATYPDLVERQTIGETSSGQPLLNVRITDETIPFDAAPLSTGEKLRIYLDGGHHGNEYLGVELVLYWLEALLVRATAGDAEAARFLAETEVYATPIVNVDGNLLDARKNARQVDPNRNYDFMWGGDEESSGVVADLDYRGPAPFSEAETKANAAFQTEIRPDAVVTMHTGVAEFYWPWGYTHDPSPDDAMFTSIEKPFEDATNGRVDAMQGAELYIVVGASDDWAYATLGAPGFTYEVHEDQFVPVYGEPIPEMLVDQLAGLDFILHNVRHLGAWVELRPEGSGWIAVNEGWGAAQNVTITTGGRTTTIPLIERDATAPVDIPVDATTTWSYPVLFINTTKTRTHTLDLASMASTPVEGAPIPGPGIALLALAALAAIRLRRR